MINNEQLVYISYRSIPSTMTHCSIYFTSTGHFLRRRRDWRWPYLGGAVGMERGTLVVYTCTCLPYLVPHPTCVFRSSVQMAPPLQIYCNFHLPFRSLSIIAAKMASLAFTAEDEEGFCLLSSSVNASATSAFSFLFKICRSSSCQPMSNSRFCNT